MLAAIAEDSGPRVITQAELLANASDVDGPALTAINLQISSGNGTLDTNGNGTWTYHPAANDSSSVTFSYSVTDGVAAPVATTASLDITPVNDAPTVATAIADQNATQGNLFLFQFAANTFNDVDGDTLTYAATLSDGSALPSWLSFNGTTRTFSGTPGNGNVGTIAVKVTATDGSNASVFDTFNITVGNTNDAPVLTGFGPSINFGENTVNATPQILDSNVVFVDPDDNFNGGTLTVSGLLAEDIVSIGNQGSGPGQIGFSGTTVNYQGVLIGTATGGIGAPLVVTFNANATSAAIDALVQDLTYQNTSDTPTATRQLALVITDAAGASTVNFTEKIGSNNPFNGVDVGNYANPAFVDLDGDGDRDVVIGADDGTLLFFRNTGTASNPVFAQQTGSNNPFNGV